VLCNGGWTKAYFLCFPDYHPVIKGKSLNVLLPDVELSLSKLAKNQLFDVAMIFGIANSFFGFKT